jgi:hypothetical protein
MADSTMTPAPKTEKYQATQDGFMDKYYQKGNLRTFNEGELVPVWFRPVAEITSEAEAARRPETQKPPKADRPTMKDAGVQKPKAAPPTAAPGNKGRPTMEDAGMAKAKPTAVEGQAPAADPVKAAEEDKKPVPEKVKTKTKAKKKAKKTKKKAKKKAVSKKAKKVKSNV